MIAMRSKFLDFQEKGRSVVGSKIRVKVKRECAVSRSGDVWRCDCRLASVVRDTWFCGGKARRLPCGTAENVFRVVFNGLVCVWVRC